MSKLSKENKFIDFSDYGRPIAKIIAKSFVDTKITPVQVTWMFVVSAFIAIYFIFQEKYMTAGVFIILKSILDAADGELARLKNTPSYTGRYLDSISDFFINFILFLVISYLTNTSYLMALLAFFCCQLQGTLYNFYYVILRNKKLNSDTTSRVFEREFPTALPGESQKTVNNLFILYKLCYGLFDWIIYTLDKSASKVRVMPKWFMSFVSIFGLGFQLLIMAVLLALHHKEFIIPFFIVYTFFIPFFIGIRKTFIS
jgi:hypothetical protein